MKRGLIPGLVALAASGIIGAALAPGSAGAVSNKMISGNCTGANVRQQAPYVCSTVRRIDGVLIETALAFDTQGGVVATYTLVNGPINRVVGVQLRLHTGRSSTDGPMAEYWRNIEPGQPGATIVGRYDPNNPMCGGQADAKAAPGLRLNGPGHIDKSYRAAAPHVYHVCLAPPPTLPPTVPPSVGPTTVPGQTTVETVPVGFEGTLSPTL